MLNIDGNNNIILTRGDTLTINSTYLIDVYELTPPQALF